MLKILGTIFEKKKISYRGVTCK